MAMVTPVHLGGRLLGGERLAQGDGDESGGADQSRGVEAEAVGWVVVEVRQEHACAQCRPDVRVWHEIDFATRLIGGVD